MGISGVDPVIPILSVCEAYAPQKIIRCHNQSAIKVKKILESEKHYYKLY
jgi:hypothetical protein